MIITFYLMLSAVSEKMSCGERHSLLMGAVSAKTLPDPFGMIITDRK
jgi:hypothetical protein